MVQEFINKVRSGEIDVVEHTKKVIAQCKELNAKYNCFTVITEELALQQAAAVKKNPKGRLAGVPLSVKDCLCVKGVESAAGSAVLEGYKPLFSATAVQKCVDEGAIIIGKTSQDEFGFGGFSVNVGIGKKVPLNPHDIERACGGSSGGSASMTFLAAGRFPHISLAESTGGSIVNPASFCGVLGLCPTYGRVSRYGLIDYGNSLDKIGPMALSVHDLALVQSIISGHDPKDSTSIQAQAPDFLPFLNKGVKGLKVGVIKELIGEGVDKSVKQAVQNAIGILKKNGAIITEISLPLTQKYSIPVYYLLATAEASTNLAKYCGMRYGAHEKLEGGFNEYFTNVRSTHFGKEAKRRIILGTFARMAGFRDAYYIKALALRTKITQEFKKAFASVDILVSPTVPTLALKFKDISKLSPLQNYLFDIMTVGPNLAGMPHLNVPVGKPEGLPAGMLLVSDHLQEGVLLQAAALLEHDLPSGNGKENSGSDASISAMNNFKTSKSSAKSVKG